MRVLICGGRDYDDQKFFNEFMDMLHGPRQFTTVIQGGARGADTFARLWAEKNKIVCEQYDADWKLYGKAAGVLRNITMLDKGKPDLVVAFPGGTGTNHMANIAYDADIWVIEIDADTTMPRKFRERKKII